MVDDGCDLKRFWYLRFCVVEMVFICEGLTFGQKVVLVVEVNGVKCGLAFQYFCLV